MKQQTVPPGNPGQDNYGSRDAWPAWYTWLTNGVNALIHSGPTAERPVQLLWVGRTYFDTDLGIPVWYDGTNWIDATGTVV